MLSSSNIPLQETAITLFGSGQKLTEYFIVGQLLHWRTKTQHYLKLIDDDDRNAAAIAYAIHLGVPQFKDMEAFEEYWAANHGD